VRLQKHRVHEGKEAAQLARTGAKETRSLRQPLMLVDACVAGHAFHVSRQVRLGMSECSDALHMHPALTRLDAQASKDESGT